MADKLEEFFFDAATRVDFVGGMIRIELATLAPGSTPEGPPQMVPRRLAIMPLEGFLHTYDVMADLLKKLQTAGIVTNR